MGYKLGLWVEICKGLLSHGRLEMEFPPLQHQDPMGCESLHGAPCVWRFVGWAC